MFSKLRNFAYLRDKYAVVGSPLLSRCIQTTPRYEQYKNNYSNFKSANSMTFMYKPYRYWFMFTCGMTIFLVSPYGIKTAAWLESCVDDYVNRNEKAEIIRSAKAESVTAEMTDETKPDFLAEVSQLLNPWPIISTIFPSRSRRRVKEDDSDGDDNDGNKEDSKKVGFRDRKFIAYEDRIRAFSTPDKIFRYFATIKSVDDPNGNLPGEVFMTPDDFLRAITPGVKQPDGLALDSFQRYDPKSDKLNLRISPDSVFYTLGDDALISFSDFIFLLTVLSTPQRQFEIAFRMFDINGDGELDVEEFERVRSVVIDTTAVGKRHRDHSTTGSTLKPVFSQNSALKRYFFGPKEQDKLKIKKFLEFQAKLQNEIMSLEFERLEPENGKISEVNFAKSLLVYAGFQDNKKRKMLKRVTSHYNSLEDNKKVGITFREFADFSKFLKCIADVDTALAFYHMAGASIDPDTLNHVAQAVANVKLSPHLVEVVFRLFDENEDGHLSNREFVSVMKNRLLRGLDRPMDTGFIRFFTAFSNCASEQVRLMLNLQRENNTDTAPATTDS